MRRTISAADAKNRLADALRRAEAGDLVLITRYRKPVAALVGGARLERLQRLEDAPDEAAGQGETETAADGKPAGTETAGPPPAPAKAAAAPTLRQLRDRAAAGSLRRIEADLARVPERLRPALRLIRANLFHPRLTVERLRAALKVGGHDFTTEFRDATGVTAHRYLTDRRLEAAARLLLDTGLEARAIGRLVGYGRLEGLARAFGKRYGVRPSIYREFEGRLSPEVAGDAASDLPPVLPRFLAGTAAVPAGAVCGRCRGELEGAAALRVFEDLAPICGSCAREQAPGLAAILAAGEAG